MKPIKLHRLALAVAAAGLLAAGISRAVSTEISAATFVTNLQQYVENGELAAAKDALRQLQSFGIKQIKIGDEYFLIEDVLLFLENPAQAKVILAAWSASMNGGMKAYFVAEDRVVASVNWTPTRGDIFPTGSAG